jgi:hypothetical protein
MAAQRLKRQARDELDMRVESAAGGREPPLKDAVPNGG